MIIKKVLCILLIASLVVLNKSVDICSTESRFDNLSVFGLNELSLACTEVESHLFSEAVYKLDNTKGSFVLLDDDWNICYIERFFEVKNAQSKKELGGCFDSLESLHIALRQYFISDEYEMIESFPFDSNTICEKYEKVESVAMKKVYNPYDSYTVFIDTNFNTLVLLFRCDSKVNIEEQTIIEPEQVLTSLDLNTTIESEALCFLDMNDLDPSLGKQGGNFKLVYIIKTRGETIYVDAYNSEVFLISHFKSVYGGAVATTDFANYSGSLNLAKTGLENLGYYTTSSVVTNYLHSNVPNYLNEGFYILAHGMPTYIKTDVAGVPNSEIYFYPSQAANQSINYKFVFLDACYTAANTTWSSAFSIYSTSTNKAFLGWSDSVGDYDALVFCNYFWNYVLYAGSVNLAAAQAVYSSYPFYCPIYFIGDYNYDGYHY